MNLEGQLETRHRPLVLGCSDPVAGQFETFVAKSTAADPLLIFREYAGHEISHALEVPIPEFALVTVTPQFSEQLGAQIGTSIDAGQHFGSLLLARAPVAPTSPPLKTQESALQAARIMVFDCAFQNHDRTTGNPNCLVSGQNYTAIDFEQAFAFLDDDSPPPPCDPASMPGIRHHLFRNALRGRTDIVAQAVQELLSLGSEVFSDLGVMFPERTAEIEQIWQHHQAITGGGKDFLNSVLELVKK